MTTVSDDDIKKLLEDKDLMEIIRKEARKSISTSTREKKSGIWREDKYDKWNNFTGYKMIYVWKGQRKSVSFNQNNLSRADLAKIVDTEILRLSKKYHLTVMTGD